MRLVCRKCGAELDVPEDGLDFECPKCHRILDVQYELVLSEEIEDGENPNEEVENEEIETPKKKKRSKKSSKPKNYQDYARTFVYHLGCSLILPVAAVGIIFILNSDPYFIDELSKDPAVITVFEYVRSWFIVLCSPLMFFLPYYLVLAIMSRRIKIHSLWLFGYLFKFAVLLAIIFMAIAVGYAAIFIDSITNSTLLRCLLVLFWSVSFIFQLFLLVWIPIKSARAIPDDLKNMKNTFHQRKEIRLENDRLIEEKRDRSFSFRRMFGSIFRSMLNDFSSMGPNTSPPHDLIDHDTEVKEYMNYLDDEAWYAQREREGW